MTAKAQQYICSFYEVIISGCIVYTGRHVMYVELIYVVLPHVMYVNTGGQ